MQWLAHRTLFRQHDHLLYELNREDPASYRNFLRVDADLFGEILDSRGGSRLVPQVPMNLSTFDKKVKKNIPV